MQSKAGVLEWTDVPVFGHPPADACAVVRPSAYGLVEDERRQLAVVRTPQGYFLPGGGMDSGEAAADTIVREVREECGLLVRIGSWTVRAIDFVYSVTEGAHFEKRSTFGEAHLRGPTCEPTETDHELLWLAAEVAATRLSHASHRWAASQWQTRRRSR